MRILPIFFAKNNTNINKTTLKKENNSSTTPIKNSYTEYFSYQDYNINFKARLNRTPENFYEQKFNLENMPVTVKNYLYEDFEEHHHMPPAQLQREAYAYLNIADTVQDIKDAYPNEPLFSKLKEVDETKPSSGILLLLKWDAQTSKTPVFKNPENKSITTYLLKKVYLEGKTIEELNKDFDKDSTEAIKKELGIKDGKYFSHSTIRTLGIKYPNLSYYNSFLATRNDKEYIPPVRTKGTTVSEETKEKLSASMTKWWAGLNEIERAEQIQKMLDGKEMSNSIFSKFQGQIMTIAAAEIGFSEKLSDIFSEKYSDENFTIDFPSFAEQQREIMLEFWNKDPNFRTKYSQSLQAIISDFEKAYNNDDKTKLEELLDRALTLKARILNKAKEKQHIRKEMQKYAQPAQNTAKQIDEQEQVIDINSSNTVNKIFKKQEMQSMKMFPESFRTKFIEFLMKNTTQQTRKELVALCNLENPQEALNISDTELEEIKNKLIEQKEYLNDLFNRTHISTAKTNDLIINKFLYEQTNDPLVFKFERGDAVEYAKKNNLEQLIIDNAQQINSDMKKFDTTCSSKLLNEFCNQDFKEALNKYKNQGFKYYPELNEQIQDILYIIELNNKKTETYKDFLKNYNATIKYYKSATTDPIAKEVIMEHLVFDYINVLAKSTTRRNSDLKTQRNPELDKKYNIDFSSEYSLKSNLKKYLHQNQTKYWAPKIEEEFLDFATKQNYISQQTLSMFFSVKLEKYRPILLRLNSKDQKIAKEIANSIPKMLVENYEKTYPKKATANNAALNYVLYETSKNPNTIANSVDENTQFIKARHLENKMLNQTSKINQKYEEYISFNPSKKELETFYNSTFYPKLIEIFETQPQYTQIDNYKEFDSTEEFVINSVETNDKIIVDKLYNYLQNNSPFIKLLQDENIEEDAKDMLTEKLVINFEKIIANDINKVW